jgi:hypothetical protein
MAKIASGSKPSAASPNFRACPLPGRHTYPRRPAMLGRCTHCHTGHDPAAAGGARLCRIPSRRGLMRSLRWKPGPAGYAVTRRRCHPGLASTDAEGLCHRQTAPHIVTTTYPFGDQPVTFSGCGHIWPAGPQAHRSAHHSESPPASTTPLRRSFRCSD